MNASCDKLLILWTSYNNNVGDIFRWIFSKELKLHKFKNSVSSFVEFSEERKRLHN